MFCFVGWAAGAHKVPATGTSIHMAIASFVCMMQVGSTHQGRKTACSQQAFKFNESSVVVGTR